MLAVVAPVLHLNVPVLHVDDNVAFSVPHTVVLFELIIGADGGFLVPIVTVLLLPDVPQLLLQVAV